MGLCVFARSDDPVYYLAVRAWVGAPAQFEDAASGAANATLAAWLASQDALPGGSDGRYRISQGREVGHDAMIELQVDDAGDVWSGGRVVTVVERSHRLVTDGPVGAPHGRDLAAFRCDQWKGPSRPWGAPAKSLYFASYTGLPSTQVERIGEFVELRRRHCAADRRPE